MFSVQGVECNEDKDLRAEKSIEISLRNEQLNMLTGSQQNKLNTGRENSNLKLVTCGPMYN